MSPDPGPVDLRPAAERRATRRVGLLLLATVAGEYNDQRRVPVTLLARASTRRG